MNEKPPAQPSVEQRSKEEENSVLAVAKERKIRLVEDEEKLDKMEAYARMLMEKYGDKSCREYRMFHLLIGSSSMHDEKLTFDFPGEDSIVLFLERLERNG